MSGGSGEGVDRAFDLGDARHEREAGVPVERLSDFSEAEVAVEVVEEQGEVAVGEGLLFGATGRRVVRGADGTSGVGEGAPDVGAP